MDIAYTNARIRGLRARLLRREDYHSLMEAQTLKECFELLRAGYYGADIDRAGVRFKDTYRIIDHALTQNVNHQIASLWKMIPERLHPHMRAFLYPWDGYNIKAIIRVITKGGDRQRLVDSLLPTGRLTQEELRELATSHSLDELVTRLSLWKEPLAGIIRRTLKGYRMHKNLMPIETAIDRYVLAEPLRMLTARDTDTTITRRLLSERIDGVNILTLFKIHREGLKEDEAESFFVEGGRVLERKLFAMLATMKERDELLRRLTADIKDRSIREILTAVHADQPWLVEEKVEELTMRRLLKVSVEEPLTIAPLFEYLYKKIREIKNIRLILRGKLTGMPDSRIREAFIEPWQA